MAPTSHTSVSYACRTSSPRNNLHIRFVCCMVVLLNFGDFIYGCEPCQLNLPLTLQSQLASAHCANRKDVCMSRIDCVRRSGSPQSACSQGTCCRLPSISIEAPRYQSATSRLSDQKPTPHERCSSQYLCMAHIDCMRDNGLPQSLCAYGSQVGSCCKLPDKTGLGVFSQEDGDGAGETKPEVADWPAPAMFFKDGENQKGAIREYSRAREAAFAKRELARQAKAIEHRKKFLEEKRIRDELTSFNNNITN